MPYNIDCIKLISSHVGACIRVIIIILVSAHLCPGIEPAQLDDEEDAFDDSVRVKLSFLSLCLAGEVP